MSVLFTPSWAQSVPSFIVQQRTQAACQFLKSLYNPTLQLIRTTPSSNLYYISNDNLLAIRAINSCDPTASQAIGQTLSPYIVNGSEFKVEPLLGALIGLPIHASNTYTIANSSAGRIFHGVTAASNGANYTVLEEVDNSTSIVPDCTYADIGVYTALELSFDSNANATGARHEMDCLNLMFDGSGLADEAYKDGSASEHGIYQTFKLALYTYALQKNSNTYYTSNLDTLLRMQGPDGGFHTGYDKAGTYAGTQENVETTAIAILTMPTTSSPQFQLPSIPSWLGYFILLWVVIAVAIVVLVLVIEQRKKAAQYRNPATNPAIK